MQSLRAARAGNLCTFRGACALCLSKGTKLPAAATVLHVKKKKSVAPESLHLRTLLPRLPVVQLRRHPLMAL